MKKDKQMLRIATKVSTIGLITGAILFIIAIFVNGYTESLIRYSFVILEFSMVFFGIGLAMALMEEATNERKASGKEY